MAWTQKKTLNATGNNYGFHVATDDSDKIYYLDSASGDAHIFQYSISGDAVTQLSNNASFDTGIGPIVSAPIYFGNNLYVAASDGGGEIRVYKYTGSGTAWTEVFTVTETYSGAGDVAFLTDGNTLILVYNDSNADDYSVRYSTNGTTWNTGTYPSRGTAPSFTPNSYSGYSTGYNPTKGAFYLEHIELGISYDYKRILEWTGTAFAERGFYDNGPTPAGSAWVNNYRLSDKLHWYDVTGAGDYEYEDATTPTGASTAPIDSGVIPFISLGIDTVNLQAFGWARDPNLEFYILGSGYEWDAGDPVTANPWLIRSAVRITGTGDTFLFVAHTSTAIYIYASDSPIYPPASGPTYALTNSTGGIPGAII